MRLCKYFEKGSFEHHVEGLLKLYRNSIPILGFAAVLSHIRALCNHWCTSSRFGRHPTHCHFGCGHNTDRISHTICCLKFWQLFAGVCKVCDFVMEEDSVLLPSILAPVDHTLAHFILLGSHICFLCFNHCRYHGSLNARSVAHHLSIYTRSHQQAALFVARLRRRGSIFL